MTSRSDYFATPQHRTFPGERNRKKVASMSAEEDVTVVKTLSRRYKLRQPGEGGRVRRPGSREPRPYGPNPRAWRRRNQGANRRLPRRLSRPALPDRPDARRRRQG